MVRQGWAPRHGSVDILLIAVLAAWLPVAVVLALLVGRTVVHAEREARQHRLVRQPRPGDPAPVVSITSVPKHPHRGHAPRPSSHDDHRIAS